MNPLLTVREMGYYLADSGARAVFAVSSVAEAAQQAASDKGVQFVMVDAAGPSAEQLAETSPVASFNQPGRPR